MARSSHPMRLLQCIALICLETTLIHLIGTLLTAFSATSIIQWPVLWAVVAIAALVTAWRERAILDRQRISLVTAGFAIATIAGATYLQLHGVGPIGELDPLVGVGGDFLGTYLLLAMTMLAWWRGTRLVDAVHGDIVRLMRWGITLLAGLVAFLAILGVDLDALGGSGRFLRVSGEIMLFIALGLTNLSLMRIVAVESGSPRGSQWRWLRSGVLSTLLVVVVGVLLLALVAEPARALLRTGVFWIVYGFALLLSPLFWLIFKLVELLQAALVSSGIRQPLPSPLPSPSPGPEQAQPSPLDALAPLVTTTTVLLLAVPILLLILLIIFATRRRGDRSEEAGEERESIFSWSALGGDLRDLLRGLRRPPAGDGGLRAVLRRLIGVDPATRIRRRYVQLLLAGEEAGVERPATETPREFAPRLQNVPLDRAAVATLTATYEQARYAPETVDEATADGADTAWQTLQAGQTTDQLSRQNKPSA